MSLLWQKNGDKSSNFTLSFTEKCFFICKFTWKFALLGIFLRKKRRKIDFCSQKVYKKVHPVSRMHFSKP